ncbi:MAG TPA: MltR family transcriptional regulator, partial [Nitrospiraceae bacterium]|nr:MltR family transcriptional regulator [Nitrospiraceae bacterium]
MDKPTKKTSEEVGLDVIRAMDCGFHGQDDRVVAIVGAAYLDSTLDSLIRAIFVDDQGEADRLLRPEGALGANGSRCQLAYCLGLITRDQRDDLKTIARIRNEFAHDFRRSSFNDDRVRDLCSKLKSPSELAAMPGQLFSGETAKQLKKYVEGITATPREKFRMSVIGLVGALLRRIHYV